MVADHEALGDIAGDIQHHTLFVSGGQIVPGPLTGGALVQIKDTDDPVLLNDLVLTDMQIHGFTLLRSHRPDHHQNHGRSHPRPCHS